MTDTSSGTPAHSPSGGAPAPSPASGAPLRIGILGASRIADLSIVKPAAVTGHRLYAVAARDPQRAGAFAAAHGVEHVHTSYDDLLADPEVEAIYNPLANGLHGPWNRRALEAGKHVLSEKPSAASAPDARETAAVAERSGMVFMEAFHYPYHPLFARLCAVIEQGVIGQVRHVEAPMRMPAPPDEDPRWQLALAGGATMDLGCYSLSCARLLGPYAGGEPRVVSAACVERAGQPGVDESLVVELAYPSGASATVGSDMAAAAWDFHLTVTGTEGEVHLPDFPRPHEDDALVLRRGRREDGSWASQDLERLGRRSSYTYQLEAFARAVRDRSPVVTNAAWSVATMELIDAAYAAAGLQPRPACAPPHL